MAPRRFPILFITSSRLGDAVLSSGLIKALVEQVDGARFTIAASALTAAPLFEHVPGLDRVIVMEKRPLSAHWYGLWSEVRNSHWGLIVDTRGSRISGLLRRSRRAVHKPGGEPVHKVIEAARLLRLETSPPAPHLYLSDTERARADALTAGDGPILAIAPAANWIGKMWPTEHFAQVARTPAGQGRRNGGRAPDGDRRPRRPGRRQPPPDRRAQGSPYRLWSTVSPCSSPSRRWPRPGCSSATIPA